MPRAHAQARRAWSHTKKAGIYYAHGFLGQGLLDVYIELARHRLGLRVAPPEVPPEPPSTLCTAWGGFGSLLILSYLATGEVPQHLWERFRRAVARTPREDLFQGAAGALPVLAVVGRSRGREAVAVVRRAHARVARQLAEGLEAHDGGGSVNLGFAHGVAGMLLAYELACALLDEEGGLLRTRAIELLLACAVDKPAGALWPAYSRPSSPAHVSSRGGVHGICNGGPGICLAALLGYRYSNDEQYASLIERAIRTVPVRAEPDGFCCGTLGRVEVLIEAYRTLGDTYFLELARRIFTRVDPSTLKDESWKDGRAGYRLAELRLSAPLEVDLPGLPMELAPLMAPGVPANQGGEPRPRRGASLPRAMKGAQS